MGQKTSPIGFRTGITLGWQSTWFAPKANYGEFLIEDQKIRRYVDSKFNRSMPKGAVAKTEIIRTRNEVKVTLHSARPGVVIGPRGGEVDRLREELEEMTGRKISVNVIEIKEPDLNATLVAEAIAEQLSKRASFRRTMKQYCELAMNAGAKGVKIICSGRLAGSEMARKETQKLGSIPLHTLDANVDYAVATSRTTYGAIGVKAWIYKGKFGEEVLQSQHRRRRRPPRRISPAMRDGGRVKAKGGHEGGKSATEANNVADPQAGSDKGKSSGTEAS
ncbi:MAG: 30S ribosomal protein S3 [Sedimentisphaerales bacterium]|jgi:small subunit ribosomal protein S3